MVRKRFDTTGTPFAGTRQEAKAVYRTRAGNPAGYGPGYGRQGVHVPRTGVISGRRQPTGPVMGPGYAWPGQYPHQYPYAQPLALPAGPALAPAALPALHGQPAAAGQVVPASLAVPAGPKPGEQGRAAVVWAWRHRWALTPLVAPVALAAGAAADPGSTTWAAGLAAAGLGVWARRGRPVGGRMLLSVRERVTAAAWCAVAAAWTPLAAWGPLTPTADALVLAAGVAWPSGVWWASRRVRPTEPAEDEVPALSETARQLIAAWPGTVGVSGPGVLRGSRIDPDTMREPAAGAWSCQVELRDDVHAETATGEDVRRGLERMLRLPVGCVELATVREDSGRLALTMTPSRHLETEDVAWPGPVITEDGWIPLAETQDGREVAVRLHNDSGVEHWWLNGASGGGKSCTSYVLMLPGIMARRQVVLYCDGGAGTSIPDELRPALARVATTAEQWRATIEMVGAILKARQKRRGAAGKHRWVMDAETDPIITLWLEEATEIGRGLPKRLVDVVALIGEQGRKLGIQVVQVTQGTRADLLIGGTPARANLKTVIAHRPGGSGAARLAMDGTAQELDLLKLPPQEGWAAIVRNGQVLGFPARVRFAQEEAVAEALDGFTARQLDGADLTAAGPVYAELPTGPDSIPADDVDEDQAHDAGDLDQVDHVDERAAVTVVDVRDADQLHDAGDDAGDVDQAQAAQQRPALYVVPAQGEAAAAGDVIEDQGDDEGAGAAAVRAANRAAVLALLIEAGPLARAELMRRTGLSRTTVGRILREDLAQDGLAEPAGDGTWRALVDTVSA